MSDLGLVEMCSLLCATISFLSLLSAAKSLLIAFTTTASIASFSLWNVVMVNCEHQSEHYSDKDLVFPLLFVMNLCCEDCK